ncbi:MAG: hypothetical protein OEY18_19030 [Candidatus Aminicenantes bacterium]|nr:hypothetical protein [Candidatus Aminicenantes bacterium]MDH5743932.1 hypothetical protein [Candidatus Aminicenantes bacterium]
MYSDTSGNPDLLSETGTIWELGFTYRIELFLKVTNVFDEFIYTELDFPWWGRYFEL